MALGNTSQAVILIVDDQIGNLDMITIHLEKTNYTVLTATSGMEALKIAKTEQPDAILLDILMPQMDGFATCEAIRADEAISDIPVIMMTVLTDTEDMIHAFEVGASDYIAKPIHAAELHARLGIHVQNRQLTKELKAQKVELEIALEQTQSEQEQRLEHALNATHTGIWEVDLRTDTLIWALQIYQIFGVEKNNFEVTLESFFAAIHPDDHEAVNIAYQRAHSNPDEIYQIEHRVIWPDGTIRWVEEKGDVIYDEDEQALKILGTVVDITARKQTELELIEARAQLAQIVEHIPLSIAMLDTNMRYLQANKMWLDGYRLEHENIIGKSHYEIFPEISDDWKAAHQHCLAGEIDKNERAPFPREDGSLDWIRWEVRPWYQNNGEIGGLLMYTEVITDRVQAEQELIETQSRFLTMVNTALDGIVIVKDDYITYANPALAEILGTTVDDLQDTYFPEYIVSSHREVIIQRGQARLRGEDVPSRYTTQFLHSAGHVIDIEISVSTIHQKGYPAVVGFVRDITERKRSEIALHESQQRLQAQTNSLITINHFVNILHQSLNFQEVAKQAVEAAVQYIGSAATIYKLNDTGEILHLLYTSGFTNEHESAIKTLSVHDTLNGLAVKSKQIIVADNNLNDERIPQHIKDVLEANNYKHLVVIPLTHNENVLGTLSINFTEKTTVSEIDYKTFHAIGNAIGIALANADSVEQLRNEIVERQHSESALYKSQQRLQAQTNSLTTINRIVNILQQSLSVQAVAEQAVEATVQYIGSAAILYKLDDTGSTLHLLHASGFTDEHKSIINTLSVDNTLTGYVVKSKQIIFADDLLNDKRVPQYLKKFLKKNNRQQSIIIPLIHNENVLGAMTIGFNEKTTISETDYKIFHAIGNAIGIALTNAQSVEQLRNEIQERVKAAKALQQSEKTARDFQEKLRQLHEISFELSQTDSIDDIYRKAIELGREKLGFDRIGIYGINILQNRVFGIFSTNPQGAIVDQSNIRYAIKDSLEVRNFLMQGKRVYFWNNTTLRYRRKVIGQGWYGMASLWDGEQQIGIMAIDNLIEQQAQRPFEEELLMLYGTVLGYLITSKEHDIRNQGLIGRLQIMNGVEQAILLALSPQAIARAVIDHVSNLTGCEYINVMNIDYDKNQLEVLARSEGYDLPNTLPLSKLSDSYYDTLKRGQPLVEDNLVNKSAYVANEEGLLKMGILSYTILPMLLDDNLVGVFILGSKQVGKLDEGIIEIAWEIAIQLSIAIQQARLREQIQAHTTNLEALVAERTQQLEDKANELEAFTYSVSHDLRSPLRAMHGFSEVLLEDFAEELPEDAQFYLNRIRHNATRLGNLIDDLLTLSRIGRRELNKRRIEPKKIIEEIFEELDDDKQIGNTKITIKDLPICEADPILLKQVWFNLITNAIKYSKKEAQPEVIIDAYDDDDGHLIYRIKDNGVGFDMQYADNLFGVFQRLHSPDEFEGTGIGLATVYRIIDRHGWTIWADSKVGEGATFCLRCS